MKHLDRNYFLNEDVVFLAKDLLGKIILCEAGGGTTSALITETEAYRAPEDKASHAYKNKRTKRTEIMFGEGGHAYVYLNYGIHHLFNVVTGPKDVAHAVLIRAIKPIQNLELQLKRRNRPVNKNKLFSIFNGPGKLTQALNIKTTHNGIDLCDPNSLIKILEMGKTFEKETIKSGPRIGIDYDEEWASKPWRFYVNLEF